MLTIVITHAWRDLVNTEENVSPGILGTIVSARSAFMGITAKEVSTTSEFTIIVVSIFYSSLSSYFNTYSCLFVDIFPKLIMKLVNLFTFKQSFLNKFQ